VLICQDNVSEWRSLWNLSVWRSEANVSEWRSRANVSEWRSQANVSEWKSGANDIILWLNPTSLSIYYIKCWNTYGDIEVINLLQKQKWTRNEFWHSKYLQSQDKLKLGPHVPIISLLVKIYFVVVKRSFIFC
jgi:hypothetical protein